MAKVDVDAGEDRELVMTTPRTTGMLLGKFMPPHLGHQFLVDFARGFVDDLTVMVCSLRSDAISGEQRFSWMREMFPGTRVVHHFDNIPQAPEEHPEFWRLWREAIRGFIPSGPDFVFASEAYGERLASELGARFVPVDISRSLVPVSGTEIRQHPLAHWRFIPPCVRPAFVKRVCVFGPESTGKTTLARDLASHYNTVWVSEWARTLLDLKGGRCDAGDIPLIAHGQAAAEEALARQANRVLFCDTDALTTTIWSQELFGDCPPEVMAAAESRRYDLYLLLDVDVPWVTDGQRFLKDKRQAFFDRCRVALESRGRPYVLIRGTWEERLRCAIAAVDTLLGAAAESPALRGRINSPR